MAAKRTGFTLIEVLIVMALIALLAAIVFPLVVGVGEKAHVATMADTVQAVREQVEYHRQRRDTPLSKQGHPKAIRPEWFQGGRLPTDPWTNHPLDVQVVAGPKSMKAPVNKSFIITPRGRAAGHTAWYNSANGRFHVKVPKRGGETKILELFEAVNGDAADGMGPGG